MAEDAITAAIQSSMTEAGLGETNDAGTFVETAGDADLAAPDATDDGAVDNLGSDDGAEGDAPAAVSPSAEPAVAPPVAEKAAPVAETAEQKAERQELEALGLKAPKPGEKENRLPHSRVTKMVVKGLARGRELATKELQPKLDAAEARSAEYARLEVMADRDPERLVELFAAANPTKWKPILARLTGAPVAASATSAKETATEGGAFNAPMPKPNVRNADGSTTYDEAGFASVIEWASAKGAAMAEERVTKKFEAEFGPIVEDHRAQAFQRDQAPRIKSQIEAARKEWGPLFEADYQKAERGEPSEILTYMNTWNRDHPKNRISFERACTVVLLPKLRADRTTMRSEILAELNQRPAATTETRQATRPAKQRSNDPITQAIMDSMAAANLT